MKIPKYLSEFYYKCYTFDFFPFQLIILVAIVLTSSNLIGYVKCKKDAGKDVKSMAGSFLGRQILTQVSVDRALYSFFFSRIYSFFTYGETVSKRDKTSQQILEVV